MDTEVPQDAIDTIFLDAGVPPRALPLRSNKGSRAYLERLCGENQGSLGAYQPEARRAFVPYSATIYGSRELT